MSTEQLNKNIIKNKQVIEFTDEELDILDELVCDNEYYKRFKTLIHNFVEGWLSVDDISEQQLIQLKKLKRDLESRLIYRSKYGGDHECY